MAAWHEDGGEEVRKGHRDALFARTDGEEMGNGGSSKQDVCKEGIDEVTEEHSATTCVVGIERAAAETTMDLSDGFPHGGRELK